MEITEPLRVGVVGAGPWARLVHAPMWRRPGTELSGIWARRREAAQELATANDTVAFSSYEELLESSDAVSFAVPPSVQAELALKAAEAGKALALDKPIALDLEAAERLADAVGEAGVGSQVLLTWRYSKVVREWLAAGGGPFVGGRMEFVSGAFLTDSIFATPWRLEYGALYDLGPHVIDLLDAAIGPITGVKALGSERWVGLLLEHESGAVSEACLSAHCGVNRVRIERYDSSGVGELELSRSEDAFSTFASEFVATARGAPHPLGAARGLYLQRIIAEAARQLAT